MSKGIAGEGSIVQKLITIVLSIFYGILVTYYLLISILINRSNFFYKKKRDVPPPSLEGRSLGVEHRFVKLKNINMHYVCGGDPNKQLMLFIHGFPEFWYSWRHQIKEFSKDYFVVAIDLRGFGETDKPKGIHNYTVDKLVEDINQLLEALDKRDIIVVAHDWGAAIAWTFTAQHGHLLNGLIILNGPHPLMFRDVRQKSFKQFLMSWYMLFFSLPLLPEFALKSNDYYVFDYFFRKHNGEPLFSSDQLEPYKYTYHKNSFTAPLNYYRAVIRKYESIAPKSYQIKVPTLIIWGTKDKHLSTELAQPFKYVDQLDVKFIDCSHWIQMEEPFLVNQYIRQYLSKS